MHPATLNLSQTLILNVMEAIDHWEHWTGVVPQGATQTLNKQLIRLSKGLVKAARIFLVERQRESIQSESERSQSFDTASDGNIKGDSKNGKVRMR